MTELVEAIPGLELHLPNFEILVIDEGHLPREKLEPLDGPVSGVFQLEQAKGLEEIRRITDTLLVLLDDPELWELRRDMATWLRRAVLPARLPGVEIPEFKDLQETKIMLEERAATWPQLWMAQGREEGHREGLQQGRREGHQEGRQEGLRSGRLEGQRQALIKLAAKKFGPLERHHKAKIAQATEDRLSQWLEEIFGTSSADQLFGS